MNYIFRTKLGLVASQRSSPVPGGDEERGNPREESGGINCLMYSANEESEFIHP